MENAKTQALRAQSAKLVDEYAAIALAPQLFLPGLTWQMAHFSDCQPARDVALAQIRSYAGQCRCSRVERGINS